MRYYPPLPPKPYCPECEKRNMNDLMKYGFNIVDGAYYWTIVPEVKACCPIKVRVTNSTYNEITLEVNGKTYVKNRTEFMKSSWRDYDSF
jgi:hypothetical protein